MKGTTDDRVGQETEMESPGYVWFLATLILIAMIFLPIVF
jgi:hypothetical protein